MLEEINLQEDRISLQKIIGASVADSTRKKYEILWERWVTYAKSHRMDILPARPQDIVLFFARLSRSRCKTVCAATSAAISWFHLASGFDSPTSSPFVRTTLAGIKRLFASPPRRMEPLTLELIKKVVNDQGYKLEDWQFKFYCVIAFFGFFRFSDMVHFKVLDVRIINETLIITVPRSKTDQYRAGASVYLAANVVDVFVCPVAVTRIYFQQLAAAGYGEETLVLVNIKEKYKIMTNAVLLKKLRSSLKLWVKNPARFSLHSFRIGGATAAANAKVSREMIATHGRWQSQCVNRYIEQDKVSRLSVTKAMF